MSVGGQNMLAPPDWKAAQFPRSTCSMCGRLRAFGFGCDCAGRLGHEWAAKSHALIKQKLEAMRREGHDPGDEDRS